MKRCSKCGGTFPSDRFVKNRSTPDGLGYWCKRCQAASTARYQAAHPDRIVVSKTKYRAAHPEAGWEDSYRQRMKRAGFVPVVERFTREQVVAKYGDRCASCGGQFEELDHYPVPVIRGGPHTLDNARPSCLPCNRRSWRSEELPAPALPQGM